MPRRGRGEGGFTRRVYLEGFILIYTALRDLQCWGCGICSAGGAALAVLALRDLQCRFRPFFQPCEICSAGNRLRSSVFRQHVLGFAVFHDGGGGGVHGIAHGLRVVFRRVRLLDPFEGRRVGFDREVPHDLTVLGQTVPAALAEARVPLVATANEAAFLESLQRGAHGPFREFGDVDDGRDLRIGCGAIVVRAVREVDEHGLRAGVAHMAFEGP